VALTLISAFPVFQEASDGLEQFLVERMIPESAQSIASYAQQFTENAARLTAVGLFFLFITAMVVLMTIDQALNEIWRVPRPRPPVQRAFIYWALLTVGPVLIGISLSLTSWVVSVSLGLVKEIPHAAGVMLRVVPIVLTGLAFSLLYITLPNRRVLWRDAFAGGFLAAAAFEIMKHGFAFYITHFPTYKLVYGAFATIPIFLMWIYLSWLAVLSGAVTAAVLPEWRERESQVEPVPGAQFIDALQVLRVLWAAHGSGEVVSGRRLHGVVKVPLHRIEAMLDAMMGARWVGRASGGWTLTRDVAAIRVADVYQLFVFRRDARLPARQSGQEIDHYALSVADSIEASLGLSVEALFRREAGIGETGSSGPVDGGATVKTEPGTSTTASPPS